jgi:hypothetical protein
MPVPVISGTQSVLVYGVGQEFVFQLTATESPAEWAIGNSETLPHGIFFDSLRGTFTGAGTTPGIWNLTLVARNNDGWSLPSAFTLGIFEPASVEVSRPVTIDLETLTVSAADVAAAQTDPELEPAVATARINDDLVWKINFTAGGVAANPPLVMAKFALRGETGSAFLKTDALAFRRVTEIVGTNFITSAFVYASLAGLPSLESWLEELETDLVRQNNVTCEFELEVETPSRAPGPQTQIVTTRPFQMRVATDIVR